MFAIALPPQSISLFRPQIVRAPKKRTMRNPQAFIGKRVDSTKWNIPEGYSPCAMTGKLHPESDLTITFNHWAFDREFRIQNGINVYDAEWLSEEGYDLLMIRLQELGLEEAYHEATLYDMTVDAYLSMKESN